MSSFKAKVLTTPAAGCIAYWLIALRKPTSLLSQISDLMISQCRGTTVVNAEAQQPQFRGIPEGILVPGLSWGWAKAFHAPAEQLTSSSAQSCSDSFLQVFPKILCSEFPACKFPSPCLFLRNSSRSTIGSP